MRFTGTVGVALATVMMLGAACGGDDDESTDESVGTTTESTTEWTPSDTTAAPTAPASTEAPATTTADTTADTTAAPTAEAPAPTSAPTTPDTTESASTTAPPTGDAAAGNGTAVVDVGGERYEFRVIQCFRDQPSVFGNATLDLSLDAIPPDTPDELIAPLMGVMDPDTDLFPLLEPVLEYGPAMAISRLDGGGDYVTIYDLDTIEYLSDPDPLSESARFLDVPDGDTGITVTGSTTTGGVPLDLTATCP